VVDSAVWPINNTMKNKKSKWKYYTLLIVFLMVGLLIKGKNVSAFTIYAQQRGTSTPDLYKIDTTNVGNLQLDTFFNLNHPSIPKGTYYFDGSFNSSGATSTYPNDFSWETSNWGGNGSAGGTNGLPSIGFNNGFPGIYGMDKRDIPSHLDATDGFAGDEIVGHHDLYMCVTYIYDGSSLHYIKGYDSITDLPCIHFLWNGVTYVIENASSTPYEIRSNIQNFTFDECSLAHFDLGLCFADIMVGLFVPTGSEWTAIGTTFHDDFLTHWPWGYIANFTDLATSTATSTLTAIDGTIGHIGNACVGCGTHIHLDATNGIDLLLNATNTEATGSSTQTFYDITEYYWEIMVSLGALTYIIARIIGSHIIHLS